MGERSATGRLLLGACLAIAVLVPRNAHALRPAFVYVNANADQAANSVAGVHVDTDGIAHALPGSPYATDGTGLAPITQPSAGAEFAHRIEISRSRNLLYAANDGSGTIAAFTINPGTGVLVPVPGSPFAGSDWSKFSGISLAVSPDGRFLYASGTSLVSFFIEPNGALTEVGARFSFGFRVNGIGVSGDNARVFVSNGEGVFVLDTVDTATAKGFTGAVSDELSIGSTPTDLRLDTPGKRLWVATRGGGIMAYNVASASATVVPGSPFFLNVTNLGGLSADFYGRTLFAYSNTGPRLVGARTNTDGSLLLGPNSPLTPALVSTGGALTPDGSLLFLSDGFGQLDAWSTADDGGLTHAAGYPVTISSARGFSSVATFPDNTPTPTPATPRWFALALAAAFALVGLRLTARRPSPTVGPQSGSGSDSRRFSGDAFLVRGLVFGSVSRRLRLFGRRLAGAAR